MDLKRSLRRRRCAPRAENAEVVSDWFLDATVRQGYPTLVIQW